MIFVWKSFYNVLLVSKSINIKDLSSNDPIKLLICDWISKIEKNYNTPEPKFLVWEDNINGRKHNPNTCKDFYFLKIQALQEYNNFILKSPIDAN